MADYLNSTTYSITWFKKVNDAGELQMSPPFQRNPVWTERQKSYLIDSILNGYPIPEIYIQEKVTETGEAAYIIVDGQQRIRSVLEFLEGEYEITEGESEKWSGFSFDDLSAEEKKRFFSYKFVVRTLPDISDDEIRSIFQRINKNNVKLNAQELRQSTYSGEFIASMNRLSDRDYWKDLPIFSPEKVRRMLDVEYISELTIAYLNGPQNKKEKLDYYYEMYEREYHDADLIEGLFDKICYELTQLLPDIKKTRWRGMIDFYTLFLVLAEKADLLPLSNDGRAEVRAKLLDFSNRVTHYQKQDGTIKEEESSIVEYASAIRNSSDLNSRKKRHIALSTFLGI